MAENIQNVEELVTFLVSMGFDLDDSHEAVQAGKFSVQEAVEWILAGKPGAVQTRHVPSLSLRPNQASAMAEGSNPFVNPVVLNAPELVTDNTEVPIETSVVSRSHLSDEQREIKERFERKQREEAKKKAREEKMQARKAREAALKRIAEDRSKQKVRKTSDTETEVKPSVSNPERVAEMDNRSQQAALQFRLPDGRTLRHTFTANSTLEDVFKFLKEKRVDVDNTILLQPFPRHEFSSEEISQSLSQLHLVPNGSLVVKMVEKPAQDKKMVSGEGVGEYNYSYYRKVDWEKEDISEPEGGATAGSSHSWGSGQKLLDDAVTSSEGPVVMEVPGQSPPSNPVFQQINQQDPFDFAPPQNPFQAFVEHQQSQPGGAFVGEGHQLVDNAHVHHTKVAVQLAREAAYQRFGQAPAPQEPDPDSTLTARIYEVTSLLALCLKHVQGRLLDPRCPHVSLSGLPLDVADKLIAHLIKEKVLKPKSLQHFIPCRLRSLVLDSYPYTTNELLSSLRYHTNLTHLSLAGCSLITDKGLTPLTVLSKLKSINLSGCKHITDGCFDVIRELVSLQTLNLEGTAITDLGLEEYSRGQPAELQQLNVNMTAVTHLLFAYLKDLPKLHHLSLATTKVSSLSGVQKMARLQSLNLESTNIITDSLLCLSGLTSLSALNISNTLNVEGDRALEYISGLPLHTLEMPDRMSTTSVGIQFIKDMPLSLLNLTNYIHVDDEGVRYIGQITSLKKLMLSNTKLTDVGMTYLKDLVNLEVLCIDRTSVSDEGVCVLKGFTNIQELSLSETRVSSEFIIRGCLTNCLMLSKLNLSNTAVTTRGVVSLRLPHLALLNLDGTRVRPHQLAAMIGSCPSLQKLSMRGTRPVNSDDES